MRRSGAHIHPGMGGRTTAAFLIMLAVVILIIARPIERAVSSLLHVLVDVIEVLLVVIVSAIGLVIVAGLVYLAGRLRLQYRAHLRAIAGQTQSPIVLHQTAAQLGSSRSVAELESRQGTEQLRAIGASAKPLYRPPTGD